MFKLFMRLSIASICLAVAACGGGGGGNPGSAGSGGNDGQSGDTGSSGSGGTGQQPSGNAPQNRDGLFLIAGQVSNNGSADGTGNNARFVSPRSLTIDGAGNLYVYDAGAIRKITPAGQVTTLFGQQHLYNETELPGSGMRFSPYASIKTDVEGNIYVSDFGPIKKISPDGTVSTLLEYGSYSSIAVDRHRNVYILDPSEISRINLDGTKTMLASYGWSSNGTMTAYGHVVDFDGNIYYQTIYYNNPKMSGGQSYSRPSNVVHKIAVDGTHSIDASMPLTLTHIDRSGNVYYYDNRQVEGTEPVRTDHYLMKKTPGGAVSTVARLAQTYANVSGSYVTATDVNGAPTSSYIGDHPIVTDAQGNIYFRGDGYIGKIDANGTASVHAGQASARGHADGVGTQARFDATQGIARTPDGSLVVKSSSGIRRIDSAGRVTTLLADTRLSQGHIASDASGNLYMMDGYSLVRMSPGGQLTTIAGSKNQPGDVDGIAEQARFAGPYFLAVTRNGDVYLTDYMNKVKRVTPAGVVTTVAGRDGWGGLIDGTGSQASFGDIGDMEADSKGDLYTVESDYDCTYRVRKITPAGNVSTVATLKQVTLERACSGYYFSGGLAIDAQDNLYVLDAYSRLIHKLHQDGTVTKIAGDSLKGFALPNSSEALFDAFDIEVVADNTLAITGGHGVVGLRSPLIGSAPK